MLIFVSIYSLLVTTAAALQPAPASAPTAACAQALHPTAYLPHADTAAWCALAAAPQPCQPTAAAVCGILLLRAGNLSAGAARLAVAADHVSHSYLGAAAEYAARQLLPSGSASARAQALAAAARHFSTALQLRRASAPLPAALQDLAQPPTMLYRSLGAALAWQDRKEEAAAVHAAGVAEGIGWLHPLHRPTLPLPLSPPCPTPFLPASDARLAPLLRALQAALPALRSEYSASGSALTLEGAGLEATAGWGVHTVAVDGALVDGACARLPLLCALCMREPLINATRQGQVKVSVLSRGAHILPHAGPSVARLRVHCTLWRGWGRGVGLLRVGQEAREWEEGQCFAFDEAFEHEVTVKPPVAAAQAAEQRVVLIFDIVNVFLARLQDVQGHGATVGGWQRHGAALTALWRQGSSSQASGGEL